MKPWLIIGVIALTGAAFGMGYYSGWQGKKAAYEADIAEAAQTTRIGNEKVNKGHDIASREIRKIPSDGCVGTRAAGASQWLLDNYRK